MPAINKVPQMLARTLSEHLGIAVHTAEHIPPKFPCLLITPAGERLAESELDIKALPEPYCTEVFKTYGQGYYCGYALRELPKQKR